ncbi:hypothetical protein MSG28_013834 [Choristoneura fumiferana]|uniref:Uncharacterized protein n=1 Tax=Choristoneura fumiferana TaxID=7141 RepID=A0ACC0KA81_CHOFU|nr:hypothetical protein MSG28_013834 [Choristoneura fumiferana]
MVSPLPSLHIAVLDSGVPSCPQLLTLISSSLRRHSWRNMARECKWCDFDNYFPLPAWNYIRANRLYVEINMKISGQIREGENQELRRMIVREVPRASCRVEYGNDYRLQRDHVCLQSVVKGVALCAGDTGDPAVHFSGINRGGTLHGIALFSGTEECAFKSKPGVYAMVRQSIIIIIISLQQSTAGYRSLPWRATTLCLHPSHPSAASDPLKVIRPPCLRTPYTTFSRPWSPFEDSSAPPFIGPATDVASPTPLQRTNSLSNVSDSLRQYNDSLLYKYKDYMDFSFKVTY